MTSLGQDIRYAIRTLRKSPGFSAIAILTLALGIGANTAIFSLINSVVLKQLPVREPGQLAIFKWWAPAFPPVVQDLEGDYESERSGSGFVSDSFSFAFYDRLSKTARSFSSIAAVAGNEEGVNLAVGGRSDSAVAQFVSGNFFPVTGVAPAFGRLLAPADDEFSAPIVAVASFNFWTKWLAADTTGDSPRIVVNGNPVPVIGAAPRGFFGVKPGTQPDLWFTLRAGPRVLRLGDDGPPFFHDRKIWWLRVIGRVRPGVAMSAALSESRVLFESELDRSSSAPDQRSKSPALRLAPADRGVDALRTQFSRPLALLMGIVGLLMAIACANVAGLLTVRAMSRRKEFALRASLGASRERLIRQLLVESVLVAAVAGTLGIGLARALAAGMILIFSGAAETATIDPSLDIRVFSFAFLTAAATGVVFGLIPAWKASRTDLNGVLKGGSGDPASAGHGGRAARRLVGLQVALTTILLVVAGLFARTLKNLKNVRAGFETRNLLLFRVRPGMNGYDQARLAGYFDELRRRLEAIPGVRSASMSMNPLLGGGLSDTLVRIGGAPNRSPIETDRNLVGPRFFETLGVPILSGRPIGERDDASAPRVAVISARLARALFGNSDPLGQRIDFGKNPSDGRDYEVVGVAGDSLYHDIRGSNPSIAYIPYRQNRRILGFLTFEIRTRADAGALVPAVRKVASEIDPDLPVVQMETQAAAISRILGLERTFAALTAAFGVVGLLLACIGLYGSLAYSVAGRTREIGVRMAVGAPTSRILRMVLRDAVGQAAAGAAVGLLAAMAVTRLLRNQLFGLSPEDPATFVVSTVLLLAAAAAAAYLPAHRAASIDPVEALRSE